MSDITKISNPEDKIRRGIIDLQKPHPFFAYLAMNLRPQLMPEDAPMPTIGVNPKGELYYTPEFVMELSKDEVMGVLAHELLHVAFLHAIRTGTRNKGIANIAQDIVVNSMVLKENLKLPKGGVPVDLYYDESKFELPKGGTKIHITDVSKKTWEEVYSEIIEQLQQDGKKPNTNPDRQGSGLGWDDHMDGDDGTGPMTEQEKQQAQQKWQKAVAEAATYAKQQGHLPAGMERFVDGLLKPQIKWPQRLLKYLRPFLQPVDWSYQRPHKKSQVLEVYLPNVRKEHCEIEVLVDTSGSIGKKELTTFLSEIVAIAQAMSHVKMWVTFIDYDIQTRYEVENGDIPKILAMEPKGGGGTSMETGLDYVKANNGNVPVVIVFTDGYTDFNKKRKDYPFDVIWVITKNGMSEEHMKTIPYGIKVKMDG